MSGLLSSYIQNPPPGVTVFRDDRSSTDATLVIAPEGPAAPGAVAIRASEDNGGGTDDEPGHDECFFSLPADQVKPFVTAVLDAAATHDDPPDVRSENQRVRDAIDLLLFASEHDGGIHSLEADHDGDGWTEPFSDRYWCGCHADDENPLWTLDWMQSDRDQTGRPDTTEVLLAWADHVLAASGQDSDSDSAPDSEKGLS